MVTTRRRAYAPAEIVAKRRKKEDSAPVRVERVTSACRLCRADVPLSLAVLGRIGHAFCRDCSLKLSTPDRVSRACRVCLADVPCCRYVFVPCGHAVCRACSLKIRSDALEQNIDVVCPFCRSIGEKVVMFEEDMIDTGLVPRVRRPPGCGERALADAADAWDEYAAAEEAASAARAAIDRALEVAVDRLREGKSRDFIWSRPTYRARVNRMRIASRALKRAKIVGEAAMKNERRLRRICEKIQAKIMGIFEDYRRDNEQSEFCRLRFSRACRSCGVEDPLLRSFFPACHHAVCRECADKATATEADAQCPTCHKEGGAIPLFEELTED